MVSDSRISLLRAHRTAPRLRVWLFVVAGISLSGCAVWPSLKSESDLKKVDDKSTAACVRPASGGVSLIPYDCIEAARNELVDIENRAGYFERATAYAGVAGGTYAGYQASITHPNHSLIKHAAIGLAALAGFSQVVGADQQITAVDAGIDALDCVREAADAIRNEDLDNVRKVTATFRSAHGGTIVLAGFTTEQLRGVNALTQVRVLDFNQRTDAFATAVANAQTTVAIDTYNAVLKIREEVRRQITTKSVDVKAVYKAQQDSVNTMIGDIANKSGDQKQAALRLQMISPGAQDQPGDPPPTTPGKQSQDTFHACVAPAPASS